MRVLIFFTFISFFSFGQQNDKNLAYQYYLNGEYEKAIIIYESLSKEKVSLISYYIGYYSCLLKTQEFKKAEILATTVYRLYPNNLNFQLEIGIAQAKQGNTKKSENTYSKVFKKLEKTKNFKLIVR